MTRFLLFFIGKEIYLIVIIFDEVFVRIWMLFIRVSSAFWLYGGIRDVIRVVRFSGGTGDQAGESVRLSVLESFLVLDLKILFG